MKSAWIVNLLLLTGVVGLVLFAIYRPKEEPAPQYKISTVASAQVNRILIEPKGGEAIELEKRGDGWFLVRPYAARADRTQVERLLDLASASSKERCTRISAPSASRRSTRGEIDAASFALKTSTSSGRMPKTTSAPAPAGSSWLWA